MNKSLLTTVLAVATVAAVLAWPSLDGFAALLPDRVEPPATHPTQPAQPAVPTPSNPVANTVVRPRIDVVFALDTTGSMGGLIAAAKEKIWAIASSMAQGQPAPIIRVGLVAYRDRGDEYVTRRVDLSADLDTVYTQLMAFSANGGGDGPEDVNRALADAVDGMSWSEEKDTYKVVFLVGDAPPHMDYQDEAQFPEIVARARSRGIAINAVQCGSLAETASTWQRIASLAQGEFLNVAQSGGAVVAHTPFDDKLAQLSAELDATRLFFGSQAERARAEAKEKSARDLYVTSSKSSLARRAEFNATTGGAANFLGEKELVDTVAKDDKALAAIAPMDLPAPLQAMAPAERAEEVKRRADKRAALKKEIGALAERRNAYLEKDVASRGGARDSLDQKLHDVVQRQAAKAGIAIGEAVKY